MFSGTVVKALCLVWIGSHPSGVGILHRCFFWVPYFVRNVLKKFEICSQPAQLVGELSSSLGFFFPGIIVRASWLVLVGSHSSGLRIMHRLFF